MTKMRPIRLSDEEWNILLRKAVGAGYSNRTEYIRAFINNETSLTKIEPNSQVFSIPESSGVAPKPTMSKIKSYWNKKQVSDYEKDGYRGKLFYDMIIDTIYEHWILNHDH